jgi:hypothetical protein
MTGMRHLHRTSTDRTLMPVAFEGLISAVATALASAGASRDDSQHALDEIGS